MAADTITETLLVRTRVAFDVSLSVAKLADRRGTSAVIQEWCFQREVEAALYGNGFSQQTGAVYRLLQRSGVDNHTLSLKKASISDGLITQEEYSLLYSHLGNVRSFSLIPTHAMKHALGVFGKTDRSVAVVKALGLGRPSAWGEAADDDGERGGGGNDDKSDDNDGGDDGESVATTEAAESEEASDSSDEGDDATSVAATEPVGGEGAAMTASALETRAAKRQHVAGIAGSVEAELEAFAAWRTAPVNTARKRAAVLPATSESDQIRIMRFLSWLVATYKFKSPLNVTIFCHASLAPAAERYIKQLVASGRKYSYASKMASSLVAVASFVQARGGGKLPDHGTVAQLTSLHRQCCHQAAQQSKFDLEAKPFLEWDAVQRVRVAAEEALAAAQPKPLKLLRDVTLLRLIADQPPDRVGVIRKLQLDETLKRQADGSYVLDLSQPGAHKTSSTFGATRTTINASVTHWLDRYIAEADIPSSGFLFHSRNDKFTAVLPTNFARLVKKTFERHGDVALCPKDTRASFITFLRSGDHGDEAVQAAALAMRHSTKIQASAAYDKSACDRRVRAAMKVAEDYSAKFTAASSSGYS